MKHLLCSLLCLGIGLAASGCAGLTLAPVDYSWPLEIRPESDAKGLVKDDRYGLAFNIKPLMYAETGDSLKIENISLRVIRDINGYYYVTAPGFKSVYLFATGEGKLVLEKKIDIFTKEEKMTMGSPAFNQRLPNIQMVYMKDKDKITVLLSKTGILQGGQK
jgi:hypothetical protein